MYKWQSGVCMCVRVCMWHLFVNRVCGNIGDGNHHYVCEDDGDIVVGGDNNNNDDDEVLTWPLSSSLC